MKTFSRKVKRALAYVLVLCMVFSSICIGQTETIYAASTKNYASRLSVKSTKVTVDVGKKATAKATVKVKGKASTKVRAKTSDAGVATVKVGRAKKGVSTLTITGKKAGTAKITVTTKAKNKKGKKISKVIKVTVKPVGVDVQGVDVQSVSASIDKNSIGVGEVAQITASVVPANATDKTLTYKSSNTAVATVNNAGAVAGVGAGKATITVTAANGKSATVDVTVSVVEVTSVTIDPAEVELTVTGTQNLKAVIAPSNASDKTVTWTSSDQTIATVDNTTGVVTGVKAGKATITATSSNGKFGKCEVTVKNSSVVADGLTIEVTNPYIDNAGNVIANTQLYGSDINVRVRLMKNQQPVGNTTINLTLSQLYGNASSHFEIRNNNLKTDADGYVDFSIGLKDAYKDNTPIDGLYQSFKVVARDTTSNNIETIPIKFAAIDLGGIQVDNNRDVLLNDIVPSDNAKPTDDGIYEVAGINQTYTAEYVTSQQVSSEEDDHRVYMSAAPYMWIPAVTDKSKLDDWRITFPYDGQDGVTDGYEVYNKVTNTTTTKIVEDVPAGLQYITCIFNKIDLSKYTAMYIDLYTAEDINEAGTMIEAGTNLTHEEVTFTSNSDDPKKASYQLATQHDVKSRIVISLVSEGQVDMASTGYALKEITGAWKAQSTKPYEVIEIPDSVSWEIIQGKTYQMHDNMTKDDAAKFIKESKFIQEGYRYSYHVPVFPFTGDTQIHVKDANGDQVAEFLYPTEDHHFDPDDPTADWNINDIAPEPNGSDYNDWFCDKYNRGKRPKVGVNNDIYAFQASNDEENNEVGTIATNGNGVIIDSQVSGYTMLKATVAVNGLSQEILNDQTGGIKYTSVQWSPVPKKDAVEVIDDFYALEGQTVEVVAQLYDKNGNKKTDSGKQIQFFDEFNNEIKAQGNKIGGEVEGTDIYDVSVSTFSNGFTDANGQFKFALSGADIDFVEGLYAVSTGYNVRLFIGTHPTPVAKANIYWIDLGAIFTDSADFKNDVPKTTANFEQVTKSIVKHSQTKVNKKWMYGYLPVARSYKYGYDTTVYESPGYNSQASVDKENNPFVSITNIGFNYGKSDINTESTLKATNMTATLTSTKVGSTDLSGALKIIDPGAPIVVTFMELNDKAELVAVPHTIIGNGSPSIGQTELKLTVDWTLNGKVLKLITPDGRNINKDTDTTVYIRVEDEFGNPYAAKDIKNITAIMSLDGRPIVQKSLKLDDAHKGYAKLNIPAPHITGNMDITVTVDDSVTESLQIEYIPDVAGDYGLISDDAPNSNYAVVVSEDFTKLTLKFTNKVRMNEAFKAMYNNVFKFVQNDTSGIEYKVTDVATTIDDQKWLVLTLDKAIENKTVEHKLTIAPYTDQTSGVELTLLDSHGKKISGTPINYTFKPSERIKK